MGGRWIDRRQIAVVPYGYLVPGWPDWANFCTMGDCLKWAIFIYNVNDPNFRDYYLHSKILLLNLKSQFQNLNQLSSYPEVDPL
jgi:hypothetical protein